jgi:hypothetical protein
LLLVKISSNGNSLRVTLTLAWKNQNMDSKPDHTFVDGGFLGCNATWNCT